MDELWINNKRAYRALLTVTTESELYKLFEKAQRKYIDNYNKSLKLDHDDPRRLAYSLCGTADDIWLVWANSLYYEKVGKNLPGVI